MPLASFTFAYPANVKEASGTSYTIPNYLRFSTTNMSKPHYYYLLLWATTLFHYNTTIYLNFLVGGNTLPSSPMQQPCRDINAVPHRSVLDRCCVCWCSMFIASCTGRHHLLPLVAGCCPRGLRYRRSDFCIYGGIAFDGGGEGGFPTHEKNPS